MDIANFDDLTYTFLLPFLFLKEDFFERAMREREEEVRNISHKMEKVNDIYQVRTQTLGFSSFAAAAAASTQVNGNLF